MSGNVLGGNLTVNLIAVTDEFKRKMNDAGGVVKTVVGKIEENKEVLRKTGLAFGAVGAAITAALGASIKQAASAGDQFDKMSKRTGESASTLSALAFAADRSGTSIESVENAIKRAQRNMADAASGIGEAKGAFDELGISVSNTDGSLKTGSEILLDFAAATADMDDASRKAALAQEIFGRSGTDLLPLFAEGADGIQALADEAEHYGIVIDDVSSKQGADLTDAFSNLRASLAGISLVLGAVLMPMLTPVINKLADLTANISRFMRENPGITKTLGITAAAFGVLATAVGGLLLGATALPALMAAFGTLGSVLAVSGPVGIALAAAAGLIYALYENWDVVCAGIQTGWETIIKPTIEFLKDGFTSVWDTVRQVFEWVWAKIETVISSVWNALTPLIDGFISGFNSVWGIVETVFQAVWDFVAGENGVLSRMYDAFVSFLGALGIDLPTAEEIFGNLEVAATGVGTAIEDKWNSVKDTFDRNMEEATRKHSEEKETMEARETEYKDLVLANDAEIKESAYTTSFDASNFWKDRHAESVAAMLAESKRGAADRKTVDLTAFEEMVDGMENAYMGDENGFLSRMDYEHAATLKIMGKDWESYLDEQVQKKSPTFFESAFKTVGKKWEEGIGKMGSAWVDSLANGGELSNAFDFAGEYLKRTLQAGLMDVAGNILDTFIQTVIDKLMASEIANTVAGLFSGIGDSLGSSAGGRSTPEGGDGDDSKDNDILNNLGSLVAVVGWGKWFYDTKKAFQKKHEAPRTPEQLFGDIIKEWYDQIVAERSDLVLSDRDFSVMQAGMINEWKTGNINGQAMTGDLVLEQWAPGSLSGPWSDDAPLTFHTGGIVPGILGQERMIKAYAGEEILRHDNPRHSNNAGIGSLVVNITGNSINSELDLKRLGDAAATQIMDRLKLRTRITRFA